MQDILHAIKRWIINLFEVPDKFDKDLDQIEYLRMELSKRDSLIQELLSKINASEIEPETITATDTKPLIPNYIPFHVRARQLELQSKKEAAELKAEKVRSEMSKKSTEELEAELLGVK